MVDPKQPYWDPAIETMPREELIELQTERLHRQVQRCYASSEFYRERFRQAGAEPGDIRTIEDLRKLPVVTKQQLRDEQAAHPPFGRFLIAPRETWRELHPSTGTTGTPVNTIWSFRDTETITDFTARTMWSYGIRPNDIVQNAFSYGLWIAGMAVHYASPKIGCFIIPIGAAMTPRQIDYILNPGSTVLIATPSYALHIAENLRGRGVDPKSTPLRLGCFGGEAGTELPSTRRKIEEGLGIDAFDYYGLSEIGPTFASECVAKAGLHWSEDHHIVEIVNPDTLQPCREGEVGALVITHLSREAMPMLRYWTGDYASLTTERCACGRTHARSIGGIVGRHDDMVVYRGAKFYPAMVEKVVRSFAELSDEFRIELNRDPSTAIDVCTVVAEYDAAEADREQVTERLRKALKDELLVTPNIRLLPLGTLERTTFKAKRIEDKRGAPAATSG